MLIKFMTCVIRPPDGYINSLIKRYSNLFLSAPVTEEKQLTVLTYVPGSLFGQHTVFELNVQVLDTIIVPGKESECLGGS